MSGHDIIVVGASAGGVEALAQLVSALPPNLPAAIFVVLHVPPHGTSVMPAILNRAAQKHQGAHLQAVHPQDGQIIQRGMIYVAPPNRHLLVKNGHIRLALGPKENSHRPAVDPLFRTAARAYDGRVVGVILSGTLDDGTAGLVAVKQQGGVAIVQNPDEALYSGMPRSAIENVDVDRVLRVSEISSVLVELAYKKPVETEGAKAVSRDMEIESDMAELEPSAVHKFNRPGKPSSLGCPECGGVLWELDEGSLTRFRCRTGHAFSIETLMAEQSDALEETLWIALRTLEEKALLAERMASHARDRQRIISAKRFEEQKQEAQHRAELIRELLLKGEGNGHLSTSNGHVVDTQVLVPLESKEHALSEQVTKNNIDFNLVAIAASAGGLKAISEVLSAIPADFPAAITLVQHLHPNHPSQMAEILNYHISIKSKQAENGDLLRPGMVYIAPPNKHLLVNPDGTISLTHTELVHFVRPSADLMFESVAASFKQRAIAVVLTGTGIDGAMGIQAIKEKGGRTLAQDPASCEASGMPQAAIDTNSIDWVLPLNKIATKLISLVTTMKKVTSQE